MATAINRLRESDAKSKVIILLTDGVNNQGQIAPMTAAEIAKAQGIRVYTIGVGTEGMAPYPAIDMFGNLTFEWKNIDRHSPQRKMEITSHGTYSYRAYQCDSGRWKRIGM